METPDVANHIRMLLKRLGTPKLDTGTGAWRWNRIMDLVPDELALYFSGHSARHVLPSICLAIGVHREEQNFLGRWEINKSGASDYAGTARQVVHRLQALVVKSLVTGEPRYDESEALEQLQTYAGFLGPRLRLRHKIIRSIDGSHCIG